MIDYTRRDRPVRRDDQQLLQRLLIDFERSQTGDGRGDQAVRAAVRAIARTASPPGSSAHIAGDEDFLSSRDPEDGVAQWNWIHRVISGAERAGNADLVAHGALFTSFFATMMAPTFGRYEHAEMRLYPPTETVCAAVYAIGLRVLPRMDPHRIVVWHDTNNSMRIEGVLAACALGGLEVPHLLDPTAVATARRVMGGGRRSSPTRS